MLLYAGEELTSGLALQAVLKGKGAKTELENLSILQSMGLEVSRSVLGPSVLLPCCCGTEARVRDITASDCRAGQVQ